MPEIDSGQRLSRRPTGRERRLLLGVSAVVLIAAAVLAYVFLNQPGGGQPPPSGEPGTNSPGTVVAEFKGDGDQTTETFDVTGGWVINWETTGERFAIAITGGEVSDKVVDRGEPGSGTTVRAAGGTFALAITAKGPWTVRILKP